MAVHCVSWRDPIPTTPGRREQALEDLDRFASRMSVKWHRRLLTDLVTFADGTYGYVMRDLEDVDG